MQWLLILSLVTGVAPPPATMPGFLDTERLMALCDAGGPDAESGRAICMGYIVGSLDQLMAQQSRRDEGRRTICPPKDMTAEDAVRAVIKYSRFGATATGIAASSFVRFAMEDSFPCQPAAHAR